MPVRALIIDCYGVLMVSGRGLIQQETPLAQQAALIDCTKAFERRHINRDQYIAQLVELSGLDEERLVELLSRGLTQNSRLLEYLQQLKSMYKLALLSNIDQQTLTRFFPEDQLRTLFDAVVVSGDLGFAKPDIRAYQQTAELLSVAPEHCLMVDDLQDNIDGARAAGMSGVLFTSVVGLQEDLKEYL